MNERDTRKRFEQTDSATYESGGNTVTTVDPTQITTYMIEGYDPETGERQVERRWSKDPEKAFAYANRVRKDLLQTFGGPYPYVFVYAAIRMKWDKHAGAYYLEGTGEDKEAA